MKNRKQIIIGAPGGKVIDLEHLIKTNEVIFIDEKPAKIEFPKEWKLKTETDSFYIREDCSIWRSGVNSTTMLSTKNRNLLPSKYLAKQMLIFTQLITMRECYREIEKLNNPELGDIDWGNIQQYKYSIMLNNYELKIDIFLYLRNTFSFQLVETRDEFAKNFGDMILQCKDILG